MAGMPPHDSDPAGHAFHTRFCTTGTHLACCRQPPGLVRQPLSPSQSLELPGQLAGIPAQPLGVQRLHQHLNLRLCPVLTLLQPQVASPRPSSKQGRRAADRAAQAEGRPAHQQTGSWLPSADEGRCAAALLRWSAPAAAAAACRAAVRGRCQQGTQPMKRQPELPPPPPACSRMARWVTDMPAIALKVMLSLLPCTLQPISHCRC